MSLIKIILFLNFAWSYNPDPNLIIQPPEQDPTSLSIPKEVIELSGMNSKHKQDRICPWHMRKVVDLGKRHPHKPKGTPTPSEQ